MTPPLLPPTRVHIMAAFLGMGLQAVDVNALVEALAEPKRPRRYGLDPCIGMLWMKAMARRR